MADKLGEAYVEIVARQQGLEAGLNAAQGKLSNFIGQAKGIMGAYAATMAVDLVTNQLSDVLNKGGSLNETLSKIGVVFGASGSQVIAMADQMAGAFGAVRGVTLDAAANFGLIAEGAGLSAEEAANLAVQLTKLADDASSMFDTPLDVALEKIRSGLVGEAEPLRTFGVLLSETAVKAQASQMGFKAVNGQLTEAEKVLARVAIITRGLDKAQGDHARTMTSYKNQVRGLSGDIDNMKESIGSTLAPYASVLIQWVRSGGMLNFKEAFEKTFAAPTPEVPADQKMEWATVLGPTLLDKQMSEEQDKKRKQFDDFMFKGGGFGAFGMMGTFGMAINQDAAMKAADKQTSLMQAGQWTGGKIGDSLSFYNEAAKTALDDSKDKQLEELQKHKELLMAIRDNTAIRAANQSIGLVVKGRES